MANGATTDQTTAPTPLQISSRGGDYPPQGNTLTLPQPAPNALALPAPQQTYADAISGHEGTGQNIHSSAFGYGQFIKPTWMQYAQAHPEKFQGMSEDQILAKRSDPAYGTDATNWLAGENAKELQHYGLTPSGQSLGIAHYIGAKPTAAVMMANDADPMSKYVSPEALAANKELTTMTVGQMKARYANTPNPAFLGGSTTPPPKAVADAAPKSDTNTLSLPTPDTSASDNAMHQMMTMAALRSMLPKGFGFQPVDYHPFKAASERGMSRADKPDLGGFQRTRVTLGEGQGPSTTAISPANVPQFRRTERRE